MKVMNVKVKHLLLGVGCIFIGWIILYGIVPLTMYQTGNIFQEIGQKKWAGSWYQRITDQYKNRDIAIRAQTKKIQMVIEQQDLNYFGDNYDNTGYMWGKNGYTVTYKSIEDINTTYEELKKLHSSKELWGEYTLGVGIMNWFAGNWQKAIELLEDATIPYDNKNMQIKKLNLAAMYLCIGESDQAENVLQSIDSEVKGIEYIYKDLLAYGKVLQNNISEFRKYYDHIGINADRIRAMKQLKSVYAKPMKDLPLDEYRYHYEEQERSMGKNKVAGKVTIDGEPLAGVLVYMVAWPDWGVSRSGKVLPLCDYLTFTDQDGEYTMDQVEEGAYVLGYSGDWQRIQGKNMILSSSDPMYLTDDVTVVTRDIAFREPIHVDVEELGDNRLSFQWNEDSPMDYYVIRMNELLESEETERAIVNFQYFSEEIKGTEYILDVEEEKNNGLVGGFSWSNDGIEPDTILDPLYHEGEYAYTVVGYKNGRKVGDSIGIDPNKPHDTVYIQGKPWTIADELLLQRKYEEAVAQYERQVKEKPNDIHSIKMLAILYDHGWKRGKDWYDRIGQDLDKAVDYYKKLEELLSRKEEVWKRLAPLYVKLHKEEQGIDYYEKLVTKDPYYYGALGDIYMRQGRVQKAREVYQQGYGLDATKNTAEALILLYLLTDEIESLEKIGREIGHGYYHGDFSPVFEAYNEINREEYDPFYALMKKEEIESARKWLENREDDLARLYKGILILIYEDRKDRENLYTDQYKRIRNSEIKKLMQYLGQDHIQSRFGVDKYMIE